MIRLDDQLKQTLEQILRREGSRFGVKRIKDTKGHIIAEEGVWILVYEGGVKIGDGRETQTFKYSECKYQSIRGTRSIWMEIQSAAESDNNTKTISNAHVNRNSIRGKQKVEIELISNNTRDLVVLTWRSLVAKQFMMHQKVMNDMENGKMGVEIWGEIDRMRINIRELKDHNLQLKQENENNRKRIIEQEQQIQQMIIVSDSGGINSHGHTGHSTIKIKELLSQREKDQEELKSLRE